MDIYRKIASATNTEDLKQLEDELADVYGPVPEEVEILLELAELRIAAAPKDIKSIIVSGQNLIFSFTDTIAQKAKSLFTGISAKPKITDSKTILLRLEKNYFEPKTLLTLLRKILTSY